MVAPGGACMVALEGGSMVAPWGACMVALGGAYAVAPNWACMEYDEIRRYDQ